MAPELARVLPMVVHRELRRNQELSVILRESVVVHRELRKNQEVLVMLPELVVAGLQVPCRNQSQAARRYSVLVVPQELGVPALVVLHELGVLHELDVPALAVPQELDVHELDVLDVRGLGAQNQNLVEQR